MSDETASTSASATSGVIQVQTSLHDPFPPPPRPPPPNTDPDPDPNPSLDDLPDDCRGLIFDALSRDGDDGKRALHNLMQTSRSHALEFVTAGRCFPRLEPTTDLLALTSALISIGVRSVKRMNIDMAFPDTFPHYRLNSQERQDVSAWKQATEMLNNEAQIRSKEVALALSMLGGVEELYVTQGTINQVRLHDVTFMIFNGVKHLEMDSLFSLVTLQDRANWFPDDSKTRIESLTCRHPIGKIENLVLDIDPRLINLKRTVISSIVTGHGTSSNYDKEARKKWKLTAKNGKLVVYVTTGHTTGTRNSNDNGTFRRSLEMLRDCEVMRTVKDITFWIVFDCPDFGATKRHYIEFYRRVRPPLYLDLFCANMLVSDEQNSSIERICIKDGAVCPEALDRLVSDMSGLKAIEVDVSSLLPAGGNARDRGKNNNNSSTQKTEVWFTALEEMVRGAISACARADERGRQVCVRFRVRCDQNRNRLLGHLPPCSRIGQRSALSYIVIDYE